MPEPSMEFASRVMYRPDFKRRLGYLDTDTCRLRWEGRSGYYQYDCGLAMSSELVAQIGPIGLKAIATGHSAHHDRGHEAHHVGYPFPRGHTWALSIRVLEGYAAEVACCCPHGKEEWVRVA